jgi:cell division protein YceG involved in septum cleavage
MGMTRAWRRGLIALALAAFVLGFAGAVLTLNLTQPAAADAADTVAFQVRPGDGAGDVAGRLHQDGLIRSALVFQLAATTRNLGAHLQPGIYDLSADMTIGDIISRLLEGHPDQPLIIVPPGKVLAQIAPGARLTEFPGFLSGLTHVNAKNFLSIATTGVLPGNQKLTDLYWFVRPKQPNTYFALEGYLLPGTYFFDANDDEVAVVRALLDTLGEQLCPGPSSSPTAYLHDHAQCQAHAATVGPKATSIFTEMDQRYATKDDATGLYDALTLASLVVRLPANDSAAPGVAGVYYNRYLASRTNSGLAPNGELIAYMDAPATAQYAQESDTPPADGGWWEPLTAPPATVDPGNAYNTTNPDNTGLMPGPIAAPTWADIQAAASAGDPTPSPYYYVVADRCGQAHYATTQAAYLLLAQRAAAGCFSS